MKQRLEWCYNYSTFCPRFYHSKCYTATVPKNYLSKHLKYKVEIQIVVLLTVLYSEEKSKKQQPTSSSPESNLLAIVCYKRATVSTLLCFLYANLAASSNIHKKGVRVTRWKQLVWKIYSVSVLELSYLISRIPIRQTRIQNIRFLFQKNFLIEFENFTV